MEGAGSRGEDPSEGPARRVKGITNGGGGTPGLEPSCVFLIKCGYDNVVARVVEVLSVLWRPAYAHRATAGRSVSVVLPTGASLPVHRARMRMAGQFAAAG